MNPVEGTYRHGQIDLDRPVEWPDGARVAVLPIDAAGGTPVTASDWGIEDDWPDTPENRAEILRRMDAVEPLEMTEEEIAQWQAALLWFDDYSRQQVARDMGLMP